MIPLHYEDEESKHVKLNSHLKEEELGKYKALVMEYWNIFVWSYKDLKNIFQKIVQYTIPLIHGTKLVKEK